MTESKRVASNPSSTLVSRLRQMETPLLPDSPSAPVADGPQIDAPELPAPEPDAADLAVGVPTPARLPAPIKWALVASLLWLAVIAGGIVALLQARHAVTIDATTVAMYAAGVFTPLTAVWVMALALLRGGVLRDESERAHASIQRLLSPVDAARVQARQLADALEAQVLRMDGVHANAQARIVALRDAQTDNGLTMASVARDVDLARGKIDQQMASLRELIGTLQGVTGRLESILPDAAKRLTGASELAGTQAVALQQASMRLADSATAVHQAHDSVAPRLETALARLEQAGADAGERLGLLEIQAGAAANALDTAAEKATVALDGSRAWVTEHIATIEHSIGKVESDIVRRLETLTLSLGETAAQMEKDLPSLVASLQTQLSGVDSQMKTQIGDIRQAWTGLIADWDSASLSAGVRLIDAMARARTIATEAVSTARTATDGIVAATENTLRQTSDKAQESLGLVLRDMRTQTAHVEELAMQAGLHRAAMARALEDQVHVDLARLSEQLIDRLNAYAVDISRIFSGDVTEQELSNYTKGDRGLFARRFSRNIVGTATAKTHGKIAERFNAEPEFADMVRRFVTGFESLLKLSEQTPEKSALTVTLLTSDLGKMYLALARAVGRFDAA